MVDEKLGAMRRRISAIRELSKKATSFINACDYDVEGETIGENILQYVCGRPEGSSQRAKFSTLTDDELVASFEKAKPGIGIGLARAGRARHAIDFLWGVNLSRILSDSFNSVSHGYKTISMGRVQGPTLGFVVQRELEIRNFVPTPYWTVTAVFEKDGVRFEALSTRGKFLVKASAEQVKAECEGKSGRVLSSTSVAYKERPPPPFDTLDLQREAFRTFGYSPSRTLQIAQRLYLDAVISYPRTSSQRLPPSIGYENIISKLARINQYSLLASELLGRRLSPREGTRADPAHPAIYPTGVQLRESPSSQEGKVFDLIVRRFLSCFAEDAVREKTDISIDVEGNTFGIVGRRTLKSGWISVHGKRSDLDEKSTPALKEGEVVSVIRISCDEKLEQAPYRYNQSTLLGMMEREGIGTKSTRAETISTLIARGYMAGEKIVATDLGIALVEAMKEHCPQIVSVELTRETERELERIEAGEAEGSEVSEKAIVILSKQVAAIRESSEALTAEIKTAVGEANNSVNVLGACPICKSGKLIVIRSRKTRKRFVGCTDYSKGCRASAPLPQRGTVKAAAKPCMKCGWPIVYIRAWRRPWRICVNVNCENNKRGKHEVQTVC